MGYDAIVVGAGLGGCAAGCVLAGSGMKVLILERMPEIGGRCSSIVRDGYTLDTGAHAIFGAQHGSIEEACGLVGKAGAIKWCNFRRMRAVLSDMNIYLDGRTLYFNPDHGDQIVFHAMDLLDDVQEMVPEWLLKTGKGTVERFMPIINKFLDPIVWQFDDVLMKDFLGSFFDWPRVNDIVNTFQCGMFGSPDWMTSTAELMRTVLGLMEYYSTGMDPFELAGYPSGGLVSIPKVMCDGIIEKGGEVRTETNVKRVIIENGKAAGVELDGGEVIRAPIVVSNGGIKETVAGMVGREHFDDAYADWIRDLKTGTSGFCLRVALDEPVTDVDMGGILLVEPGGMEEYFRELWQDFTIPDVPPPMYFSVPSNMDPSLAPPGKQLIVGIGCLMFDSKEPYSKMEELALEGFRRAFPGFDDHYIWHDFLDPNTYIALGERLAPAIGLAQCVGQVGSLRPSSISPVDGLYYVGGEAGQDISGMACDLCVKSGLAAGKHIVSNTIVGMAT